MLEVNGNYGTLDRMGSGNFVQCQLRDQMVISPIGFSQRANCCAQLPQHRNSLVLLPHLSFKFLPPPTQQASQSTRLASLSAEEWHAASMVLRHGGRMPHELVSKLHVAPTWPVQGSLITGLVYFQDQASDKFETTQSGAFEPWLT